MVNTDAVAVLLVAGAGVIDAMEASVGVFGSTDKTFLAAYQAKLASARTTQTQDQHFVSLFTKYFDVRKNKTS